MGADLGVPLSDLRLLCVSVAGGESRKTFTQFSKRENVKTLQTKKRERSSWRIRRMHTEPAALHRCGSGARDAT